MGDFSEINPISDSSVCFFAGIIYQNCEHFLKLGFLKLANLFIIILKWLRMQYIASHFQHRLNYSITLNFASDHMKVASMVACHKNETMKQGVNQLDWLLLIGTNSRKCTLDKWLITLYCICKDTKTHSHSMTSIFEYLPKEQKELFC